MAGNNDLLKIPDQMGNEVVVAYPPQKIVSLVPSQTELLFDLGLDKELVGITKFCVHPKHKVKDKIKIGGTKHFNFDRIDSLQPDLIIGNKEENYKAGIQKLRQKYPVWMSDIANLEQAYEMMLCLGKITGKDKNAVQLVDKIKQDFQTIDNELNKKVLYFIWKNPYMAVGEDTFIHHLLEKCGFKNLLTGKSRYPKLTVEEVRNYQPELILLSSEPYPFQEKHVNEFRAICPDANIAIVDGELFSWYGSRLQYAPAYFREIKRKLTLT